MTSYRVDFDKRTYVRQPNFNRNRLPLRAPIKSVNVNLEDHQLSYDIVNLNARMTSMSDQITENYTTIEDLLADVVESLRLMRMRLDSIEAN